MKDPDPLKHLRTTAPTPLEDISDEAWKEFNALSSEINRQFEPTRTLDEPAAPVPSAPPAPSRATRIELDDIMSLARRHNRVCPLPAAWAGLRDALVPFAPAGDPPPGPVDGDAWRVVPPMQKRLRLKDQLEWAERHRALETAWRYLEGLIEEEWLHF